MEKISLIGGSGFIGSRLVKKLKFRNESFTIFDEKIKKDDNLHKFIDIKKPIDEKKIQSFTTIINLAAVHRDDVKPFSLYEEVNFIGAKNICDVAKKNNINKVIFISSVAVYGNSSKDTDESGDFNFFNEYGRTKYLAEKEYIKWYEEAPLKRTLIIIRPTVVFGEGNRGNVYNLLNQIAKKRFIMIGKGRNKKSMAYVENVSDFIYFSLSFKQGLHIYNYVDKPDYDMRSLVVEARKFLFNKKTTGIYLPIFIGNFLGKSADLFSNLFGLKLPISSIRIKKFVTSSQFSSSVEKSGFIPSVTLEDGLLRTLRYEFNEDNKHNQKNETE